jgi:N-acetylneuraminic acid mutarotase
VRWLAAALLLVVASCSYSATDDEPTSTKASIGMSTTTTTQTGWIELAPMGVARSEHPAVVLANEIVVLGGLIEVGVGRTGVTPTVEAYTPGTDSWHHLPQLPEARHHGMAAVVGDRLFFIGGYTPSGDPSTAVWELVNDTWVGRAPTMAAVGAAAAVVVDQTVYVVGGVPDGLLHAYDVTGDQWSDLPGPTTQREHVAAVALNGEVWAIAGRWMGEIFPTTEIYDPGTATWRPGPSLSEARSGFGAAVVGDGIIVAGGEVFDPDLAMTSVETVKKGDQGWRPTHALPHGLHGNPLVVIDGEVYLPGGSMRPAGVANDGATYRLSMR